MSTLPVRLAGTKAETLMWAEAADVEPAALDQLRNIASLPWVAGLRVMPDVHLGKGATVGSVIAMRGAVSPNAVGVDIGCGMIGVRTSLTAGDLPDDLGPLRAAIEAAVPVGFHSHKSQVDLTRLRPVTDKEGRALLTGEGPFWAAFGARPEPLLKLEHRARCQLGTLGGGNHFIELCLDGDDRVWLQLHSGSRHIGKEIAEHHAAIARHLPHNATIADRDLAVLLSGTDEMRAYLADLTWAQEYAARSRAIMLALAMIAVRGAFPGRSIELDHHVNCHHNYVAVERIDGEDLIVTRKGAIRAGAGELGLIPGSMGTGSYVVRGLGNSESYWSASHGAGRRMSRTAARRTFSVADLAAQTEGIECRKDSGIVDEIPAAYKDLDQVIDAQRDLVAVVARLRTILCVKG